VLYFQNRTGDPNLDKPAESLSTILFLKLQQSKNLVTISDDRVFEALSDLKLVDAERFTTKNLRDIARKTGASHILRGELIRPGNQIRVVATLQESRRINTLGSYSVEKPGENPFDAIVDELTPQIKSNLMSEAEIEADDDMPITDFLSSDPQARQLYIDARALRLRDWRKSIEMLEKAVEIDPQFAMAYRLMASIYWSGGYNSQASVAIRNAGKFLDRLPLRDRLLVQSRLAGPGKERVGIAKQLLEYEPPDEMIVNEVAAIYLWNNRWELVIELIEAQRKRGRLDIMTVNPLIFAYCADGQYDIALKICDEYDINLHKIFILICQGIYDQAISAAETILDSRPNSAYHLGFLGDAFHLAGDFERAEETYRQLLNRDEKPVRDNAFDRLHCLFITSGRFEEAKAFSRMRIEPATKENIFWDPRLGAYDLAWAEYISHDPQAAWNEYQRGHEWNKERWLYQDFTGVPDLEVMLLLSNGRTAEAQALVEEFRGRIEGSLKENPFDYRLAREADYVQGIFDLEQGNYSSAIEHLKSAISLLPAQSEPFCLYPSAMGISYFHAAYMWHLAEAYRRSGDLPKALEEYEKITRLTTGRLWWGDLYAKSFYMLGKISEQRGWPGKAIDYYEQFLEVWKDADPDIPELIDAKKRLAELRIQ
jgi:tetratricopeptide (TPR) repeat protein/TolB-like protein